MFSLFALTADRNTSILAFRRPNVRSLLDFRPVTTVASYLSSFPCMKWLARVLVFQKVKHPKRIGAGFAFTDSWRHGWSRPGVVSVPRVPS